ncbi:hypothetical protein D3C75_741130 [compost metagenome]
MLFVELQRVNHTQHFVDVTTQRQIVHDLVTHDTVRVDQEGAAQCHASVRMFDTVSLLDFTFDVRNHCVFHRTDAAVVDRGVTPCVVYKLRVEGDANHFYATLLEFFITLVERDQLRRANEGKVHRPEEQNGRFTIGVLLEVEVINDFTVAQNCCSCKIRSRTSYQNHKILL